MRCYNLSGIKTEKGEQVAGWRHAPPRRGQLAPKSAARASGFAFTCFVRAAGKSKGRAGADLDSGAPRPIRRYHCARTAPVLRCHLIYPIRLSLN
jgi:hypothetical protein